MSNIIERAIYISSIDREKAGISRADDFTIKFTPSIKLDSSYKHEIAVDRISMTYSWHNVNQNYNNNSLKYSHDNGITWNIVTFPDGMYSYSDLNGFLHNTMKTNNHYRTVNQVEIYDINIVFVLSTYKVVLEISNNYQIDIRNGEFGELIGFDKKIVTKTEYGSKLPNITNSIDSLHINIDVINDSIVGGSASNTIYVLPTDTLERSYPFTKEPKRALFNIISTKIINTMRIYVTDSIRRPVDLNGIDWYMTLILRSSPNNLNY